MKYIAHRGLLDGPDDEKENHPAQVTQVLSQGFDSEVDFWVVDSELWLGHNEPQYKVDQHFIVQPGLWIHAKNVAALEWLHSTKCNYFWHDTDEYTLTSHGYVWAYPGKILTKNSVCVKPDPDSDITKFNCYAVCSNFVRKFKNA